MTRDQLVTRAQLLYNEPASSDTITTSDFQTFADAINQEIARDCRTLPLSATSNIVSGTRAYALNASLAGLRKGGVLHSTTGALKGPMTLEDLYFESATWRTATGAPTHWYFETDLVGTVGSQNFGIGLYPVPDASLSSGLILLGWGIPSAFAAGTDTPQMPTALHEHIAWGMCWLAAVKDLDRTGINKAKLEYFEGAYNARKTALLQHMIDFGMEGWAFGPPLYMTLQKAGAQ